MQFDPRTLYFMSVVMCLTVGLITVFFGGRNPVYHSVRDWGLATIFISAGLGLITVRDITNDVYSVMAADLLIVSGMVLTYRSFKVYRDEPTRDRLGWALVAMTLCAVVLWQAGVISLGLRSAAVTGSVAIITWRCAWLMSVKALPVARHSQFFTAGIYLLFATLNTVRTASAVFGQTDNVLIPKAIEIAMISGDTVLWMSVALCVMWMVVERQQADLVQLATHDPLTGALNRNMLLAEIEREKYRCGRSNASFAVAMFDIDNFKRFNDVYGHLIGDEVLRRLVTTLREVVRKNDSISRYGGEEFVILMPDTDRSMALQVAERARASVEARGLMINAATLPVTASAGVAVYPQDGNDWDTLIGAADAALYQAKAAGRNCVCTASAGQPGAAQDAPPAPVPQPQAGG